MTEPQTIMGIDPSLTCTGVAVLRDGALHEVARVRTSPRDGDETARSTAIVAEVMAIVREYQPTAVGIEWQYVGRPDSNSALKVAALRGALAVSLSLVGLEVVRVQPSSAKLALVGRGNASKKQVQEWVRVVHGTDVTQDEADAVAVATFAEHKLRTATVAGTQQRMTELTGDRP